MKKSSKSFSIGWLIAATVGVLTLACSPSAGPAAEPKGPASAVSPALVSSWDQLVQAAQKEGTLNIYATDVGPLIQPLREAFKQKFGINLEFVTGRPPEVTAKITAERRAGLYLADIGHMGETTSMMDVRPLGITVPLTDLLVLPEVKDPKNWIGDRLPFVDKEQHYFMFMTSAFPQSVVNTDLVKPGEITSLLDLLQPRWKEKMVFADPTVSGGSPNMMAAMARTFGKEKALQIFRQIAAQEPAITRNNRLLLEWVARGKYLVGLGGYGATLYTEFKRSGAPVKTVSFKEPRFIYGGPGTVMVFDRNPNPKATQVYVNWLLSKEGSSLWSRTTGHVSARVDVSQESREWVDPETIARADDVFPDAEQLQLRLEMREISATIFGHLMK